MQLEFERLEQHKMKLMPIYNVDRKHIRLDRRILRSLFTEFFPDDTNMKALNKVDVVIHPDEFMLPDAPTRVVKKKCASDDEWNEYKKTLEVHEQAVKDMKNTAEYKNNETLYKSYHQAESEVLQSFFKNIPKKNQKNTTFDCSIVTDGVSVSLQYSKTVAKPITTNPKKRKAPELTVVKYYDRNLDMYDPETGVLTLGLDPGRTNIACLGFISWYKWNTTKNQLEKMDKPQRYCQSLTRSSYRTQSGITKQDAKKACRFKEFESRFSGLGHHCSKGCGLRTSKSHDIWLYMTLVNGFAEEWWKIALARVEVRAKLSRYIGKRKVLDGFYARVLKKVASLFPKSQISIAYGSAGLTMKSGGKGEVSVPTTDSYKACKRVCKSQCSDCSVGSEINTTKSKWETGLEKERVYKIISFDEQGQLQEKLCHTESYWMPKVKPEHEEAVQAWVVRKKQKMSNTTGENITPPSQQRTYPEVRGLRFCSETRMYYNRDEDAAIAIGRLKIMERKGLVPSCFTRTEH